jgi:hypothetical protein
MDLVDTYTPGASPDDGNLGRAFDRRLLLSGMVTASVVGAALAVGSDTVAQSNRSPATGTWDVNANSFEGDLIIDLVDGRANVAGSLFGNDIFGFWDPEAQMITFVRVPDNGRFENLQVYTGYLFQNPDVPGAGQNFIQTLAGSFQAFGGTGGTAQRPVYGWFARIEIVG